MFICKECFDKMFINWVGLCPSKGPCEICSEVKVCDDYPSKYLTRKSETPELLKSQEDK